jgi:hypothetical protein
MWVFCASFLLAALATKVTPEAAHELSRLGTVESLVERGTFRLDDSTFAYTRDKISRDGHFYSHQPPLLSLLETPVYVVLRLTGMRFNNSGRLVLTYAFSLLTNGLALALTSVVFYRVLVMGGVAPRAAVTAAISWPLATWLLPYGLVVNNHGISGLLLAVAAWLLLTIEWQGAAMATVACLGLVMGLLSAIEILPLISFVPLAVIVVAVRRDVTPAMRLAFAGALLVPLIGHAAANVAITGDVIPAGFHHDLFIYAGSGLEQDTLTGSMKHGSVADAAGYTWQALVAGRGYFTFAPLLALAVVAAIVDRGWWAAARGTQLILLGGAVLSLAAALLTTNNLGGEAVGFRHAAYLGPALLVFLLPWIGPDAPPAKRRAVAAVTALSAASMIVFAAMDPWAQLTPASARIGAASEYTPAIVRLLNGTLREP